MGLIKGGPGVARDPGGDLEPCGHAGDSFGYHYMAVVLGEAVQPVTLQPRRQEIEHNYSPAGYPYQECATNAKLQVLRLPLLAWLVCVLLPELS